MSPENEKALTAAKRAADIDDVFSYHSPTPEQLPKYAAVREAARVFAHVIDANTPGCADRTAALRKLRECVMTANAAIALNGKSL